VEANSTGGQGSRRAVEPNGGTGSTYTVPAVLTLSAQQWRKTSERIAVYRRHLIVGSP
jgi:hypothetical protein